MTKKPLPDIPLQNPRHLANKKVPIEPEIPIATDDVEEELVEEDVEVTPKSNNDATTIHEPNSFDSFESNDLLAQLLEGKPDAYKAKLEALVRTTGVTVDDPIFLILVGSGRLELLLEEAPQVLGKTLELWSLELETWRDKLKVGMELAQRTAVISQEAAIASAIADLIKKTRNESSKNFLHAVPKAGITIGACVIASLSLGFVSGVTVPPYMQGGLASGNPVKLTRAQANALDWAMTSDGKKARQIFEWNKDYINTGQCLEDAKKLAEKFKIETSYNSRPATDGFCTLWVKPPEERGTIN